MKFIYLANARIPTRKAHGLQIMKMCEAFALAGLEVELLIPWRFSKTKGDPFQYYQVKKIFKINKLPSIDLIPLTKFLSPVSFWVQAGSFTLFSTIYLFFKKIDIIYSRDLSSLFLLSFFRKNLIYEGHTFPSHYFWYRGFFRRIKGLIVITQKIKELFTKQGIPAKKILVAPDGVDIEEFNIPQSQKECRQKLGLPPDKKIVGYIGQLKTMEMEKGIGNLIRALKELKKNNASVVLCIVGGLRSDIKQYQSLASKIGLSKEVLFIGQVNHSLVPYYLKSFDVCLMPFPWTKHFAYYMSPLKLFEYMASPRPIVSSDLPSVREILNEENAILIKPNDVKSLVQGIEKALKNKDFSANLSRQASLDVRQYTWQKRTKKIINFIVNQL